MKYFVTCSAMDHKLGGNPFWHSQLLFSQWDDLRGGKMEVVDHYGFYGLPGTDEADSWSGQFKRKLRLDTDFHGNHGWLKHEDCRDLDRGYGLHGLTYELDERTFSTLLAKCKKQCMDQSAAVDDAVSDLGLGKKPGKYRMHPYEHHSASIFKYERELSEKHQRPSRLAPFDLNITFGLGGPSVATSHTCKSHVVGLLKDTLDDRQIARITENGKHPTVPRFSGPMESIILHSEGPLRTHEKKNGDKVDYRDNQKDPVRLFWTIPPQEIETVFEETKALFLIDPRYRNRPKELVEKLQKLEWFFRNQSVCDELKEYPGAVEQLVLQIQTHYKAFAEIPAKIENERPKDANTWGNWLKKLTLFPPDQNNIEVKLKENLRNSTYFLSMIYTAIVDDYVRDDIPGDSDAAACFPYLSVANQKKVCAILERPYLEPPVEDLEQVLCRA